MILESIIGALVPVGAEAIKGLITKFTGGKQPPSLTADDQVKLDESEIKKLQAIAALDNPGGTPSQWVIDLRASARYITAGIVIFGSIALQFTQVDITVKIQALEAANIVFGFLFGSRIVAGWKR